MIVHSLTAPPSAELARALAAFETQFTYPLGPGRSFRICHGDDYARFFRAIGDAACFVAERQGCVLGTLGAALRRLRLPGGTERSVLYLGDLKVAPSARGSKTLLRLVRAAQEWASGRADAAFGVVMDGTTVTPERYTGQLGIPPFRELGKVMVLRLSTATERRDPDERFTASIAEVSACYRRLSAGRYAGLGGNPLERSETAPIGLLHPNGSSCGRLEDTRRAKRLLDDDDVEMRAAHLSEFAFVHHRAGVELLREALRRTALLAFPVLFVAVPHAETEAILHLLPDVETVAASASVYGAGLEPFPLWQLNTAEI